MELKKYTCMCNSCVKSRKCSWMPYSAHKSWFRGLWVNEAMTTGTPALFRLGAPGPTSSDPAGRTQPRCFQPSPPPSSGLSGRLSRAEHRQHIHTQLRAHTAGVGRRQAAASPLSGAPTTRQAASGEGSQQELPQAHGTHLPHRALQAVLPRDEKLKP